MHYWWFHWRHWNQVYSDFVISDFHLSGSVLHLKLRIVCISATWNYTEFLWHYLDLFFSIQLEVKPILTYRTISSLLYFWSSLQTWNYTKFFCSSFQNHPHIKFLYLGSSAQEMLSSLSMASSPSPASGRPGGPGPPPETLEAFEFSPCVLQAPADGKMPAMAVPGAGHGKLGMLCVMLSLYGSKDLKNELGIWLFFIIIW